MFQNRAFDTTLPAEHGSDVSCSFSISRKLHVFRVELCNLEVKCLKSRNLVVAGLTRGNGNVVLPIREKYIFDHMSNPPLNTTVLVINLVA